MDLHGWKKYACTQKIITVSQLATVLWQFLYLSLKPNIAQILLSRISWRRRSRISTTLVLVCIHLIFWLGYVEIWRHGNFSFSSILRGVGLKHASIFTLFLSVLKTGSLAYKKVQVQSNITVSATWGTVLHSKAFIMF